MANSYVDYTGNGTQRGFTVTFPYIARSHVSVYVDEASVPFTWTTDTFINLSAVPPVGSAVRIKRTTPKDTPLVDFTDGSRLSEDDLDKAIQQVLYSLQEYMETDYSDMFLEELAAKADAVHAHAISGVTGLQAALDGKAASDHNHNDLYSVLGHTHDSLYAAAVHNHNELYSLLTHNHDSAYAALGHDHDSIYAVIAHNHNTAYAALGHDHNELYSLLTHNHDTVYAALSHNHDSDYADISHNHDTVYAVLSHNHNSSYASTTHTHAHADLTSIPTEKHRTILYGTGDPPAVGSYTDGTLYFKHAA